MYKPILMLLLLALFTTTSNGQKIYNYPVLVSFNSMCCGVPDNRPVMKLVNSFKKQYKIKHIAVDSIGPMGKEGEYYLAFKLKEMTIAQKTRFIQQLKKIVPGLKDRGSAELKENMIINKQDLSPRSGITTLRL